MPSRGEPGLESKQDNSILTKQSFDAFWTHRLPSLATAPRLPGSGARLQALHTAATLSFLYLEGAPCFLLAFCLEYSSSLAPTLWLTLSHFSAFSLTIPSSRTYHSTYPAFMGVLFFQNLSFLLHQDWVDVALCYVHRAYLLQGFMEWTNSLSRAKKATYPLQCPLCLTILPPPTTTLYFLC